MKLKGIDSGMTSTAVAIAVLVIVLGITASILTTIQGTQTNTTAGYTLAYNITGKGLTGMSTFADFVPVLVVIAILGIVVGALGMYMRSR